MPQFSKFAAIDHYIHLKNNYVLEKWPSSKPKLISLIAVRFFLTSFLLAAVAYEHFVYLKPADESPIEVIYIIVALTFLGSICYYLYAQKAGRGVLSSYLNISIDSLLISIIIYVTGGYDSLFTFLYLLLVIYACTILYLYGGLFIAALSSLQYAALMAMEHWGYLVPLGYQADLSAQAQSGASLLYRVVITATACFAVAVLSGLLTEQNRRAQSELKSVEDHLKRVEKMAYMGEMAAGLAHEIKNPLASLVGSIQLLKEELRLDADHQRLMEIVLRETDRLSTLVNDFLFFARPPAGKPEKLHLKDAIDDVLMVFSRDQGHLQNSSIAVDVESDLWVLMDSSHLKQIIWNLLLNAAEAVETDGRILVRAFREKKHAAKIQVEDNGCGIPSDLVHSIFDPFFTTKSEGTGLGLSIVHRILEAYESRLEVQSRENAGTVFSFALQCVTAPS